MNAMTSHNNDSQQPQTTIPVASILTQMANDAVKLPVGTLD